MKTDMMPGVTSIQDEKTRDIFILNCTISVISGSVNPVPVMTCAAPEGTPPRRFNYLKIPLPSSQEPGTDACQTFTIFHGLGEDNSRSCPFLQSKNIFLFRCARLYRRLLFMARCHRVHPLLIFSARSIMFCAPGNMLQISWIRPPGISLLLQPQTREFRCRIIVLLPSIVHGKTGKNSGTIANLPVQYPIRWVMIAKTLPATTQYTAK